MRKVTIVQGEHLAVREPGTVIATLLGSCIAVCLHDALAGVGGMNHFLLGEPDARTDVSAQNMNRYGIHAMELLINAMMQHGAARPRLRAHIYGGATIVAAMGGIGSGNAAFAKRFIETEGIAIGHVDTGGTRARRVDFLAHEGKVRSSFVAEAVPLAVPRPPARALAPAGGDLELF